MARKASKRQISFSSLLEPDVPLDARVVLIDDPRWAATLNEMSTTPYAGIDSEGFDDSTAAGGRPSDEPQRGDFDPFASTIRLLQVALPSGVCAVADLGGIGDDRSARYRLYGDEGIVDREAYIASNKPLPYVAGSFFAVLRDLVEDPKRSKILHHAKFDALWLRIHFGWRMRGIRCTMLLSQLYWAGLQVRHGLGFLSERAVAASAPGVWLVSKELQKSEWRWRLSNAQINYAATDALVMLPLFKWLGGLINAAGMLPTALAECNAVAAFVEFEYNGLTVNPAMLADHIELWRRGRELAIQPFRQRYPGVDPAKTQMVAVALSLDNCYDGHRFYELDTAKPRRHPLHILGQRFDYAFKKKNDHYAESDDHSVAEAVLTRWSNLPWISALLDWRSMGVVLKWMESIAARLRSDARVRGEYAQLAGGVNRGGDDAAGRGHGRSSCARPSLQQSANAQPKLNKLIHQAMGWTGEVVAMSPRLPFVGHDAYAAGYLRWAVARLRGELADPFAMRDEAVAPQYQQPDGWTDEDAAEDAEAAADEPTACQPLPNLTVTERIAWYERLASQWEAQPRRFIVADFSQAHMRIAAQVSQDPQLCEDFRLDRDAHLKLAYDFGVATKQIPADLPIEAFFAWYDKRHPKHKFVKSLRQPAKTGNYTSLNLGSVARLKGAGDTAKPPVVLTLDEWGIIRDAWRKRYAGLFGYQKDHIAECNAHDVVIDGTHYGIARALVTGGRLWLRKEVDKYDKRDPVECSRCGRTHGRLTVKGTDATAYKWLRTEADAIKWALARILEEFDQHDSYFMERGLVPRGDVWGALLCSMAHDEADVDADARYALATAGCVRRWFGAGLRWAGVVDIPVEPADSRDVDLVVKSWADK